MKTLLIIIVFIVSAWAHEADMINNCERDGELHQIFSSQIVTCQVAGEQQ